MTCPICGPEHLGPCSSCREEDVQPDPSQPMDFDQPRPVEVFTRFAIVTGARDSRELDAYLPANYRIIAMGPYMFNRPCFIIGGTDNHGWTLDDYVIPRLASGMIRAHEFSAGSIG